MIDDGVDELMGEIEQMSTSTMKAALKNDKLAEAVQASLQETETSMLDDADDMEIRCRYFMKLLNSCVLK